MFGSSKKTGGSRIETVIGQQTVIDGDLHFSGGLHVDGTIRGNVVSDPDSDALLTISEKGCIEGEVRVPSLELNGAVVGDVYASDKVELASHARVNGNVYYNLLEMAMGAEVNGKLVHQIEAGRRSSAEPEEASDDRPVQAIS